MATDYIEQGDGYEAVETDRADCLPCNGTGSISKIVGDEDQEQPCPDCGGMGYELTRDEFANLDAIQGDRDLRLVAYPEDEAAA